MGSTWDTQAIWWEGSGVREKGERTMILNIGVLQKVEWECREVLKVVSAMVKGGVAASDLEQAPVVKIQVMISTQTNSRAKFSRPINSLWIVLF